MPIVKVRKGVFRWEIMFLKLPAYHQKSLANAYQREGGPRYYGPYKVLQKIRTVAYKLELLQRALIHPIFHVSQLKPVNRTHEPTYLPPQTTNLVFNVLPKDIVVVRHYNTPECEVLVSWQGPPSYKATWKHYATLKENISKGRWRRLLKFPWSKLRATSPLML